MSGHRTRGNKVVERQTVESAEHTPWTFCSLVDGFGQQICPLQIIASSLGVLDIIMGFEMFEVFCPGVVDILGVGDELRRRRNVGGRHFNVEDGSMV